MSWQDHAACRKHPEGDVFFAPDHEIPRAKAVRVGKAKAICATCPVIEECLAYAERHDEDHGIWGGLTENERGRDKHRHGRKRQVNHIHGTTWGAQVHRARGEKPCDACRAAVNEYMREYKREKTSRIPPPGDPRHGSIYAYRSLGCRCPACKETQRIKVATDRTARAQQLPADDPRHGQYSTFDNFGCRCPACTAAKSEANSRRKRKEAS